jgi:type II secretory pathway pseudopilin PulG
MTLLELLIAVSIAAVIVGGLNAVLGAGVQMSQQQRIAASRQASADFAFQRISLALSETPLLLIPQIDNTNTSYREDLRRETVPASSPQLGSSKDSAVLAVILGAARDLDGDGVADCDNDDDGKCNEDSSGDRTADGLPGIAYIDDDGDGVVDNSQSGRRFDDDEDGVSSEDPINGVDDDGDGRIDEDPSHDWTDDNEPGVAGVDDDGDGQVDEGWFFPQHDNDEDGDRSEDPTETVVFYLQGSTLMERSNVPWDEDNSGVVSGRDFVVEPIAENITLLSFERIQTTGMNRPVVRVILEIAGELRLERDMLVGPTL